MHEQTDAMSERAPRTTCARCRRPTSVCYCAHLSRIETRTRVVILQHPRERDMPIGTARMASLCLPSSQLHVGIDWGEAVMRGPLAFALNDPERPAALLYPGETAIDVMQAPPAGPVTLVVVDGTWSQTKKVVRANPALAALPRYAFTPPRPSDYRIRMEPDADYVSTIEALVHVLGALEGDADRFVALLAPFRAMVDAQVAYAQIPGRGRSQRPRGPKPKKQVAANTGDRWDDLVCVTAEVNAWPYRSGLRAAELAEQAKPWRGESKQKYPDELVHWVACRVATGETFECVLAPRHALCESTPTHIAMAPDVLLAGSDVADFLERWRAFVRCDDVLCGWGDFALTQLEAIGGALPSGGRAAHIDVRQLVRRASGGVVGTAEAHLVAHGIEMPMALGMGRGGMRLGLLVATVASLLRAGAAVASGAI